MTDLLQQAWAQFCDAPGEATFLPFYEQSKGLVYTLCSRVLGGAAGEDAADAFQAAYARLLREHPAVPANRLLEIQPLLYRTTLREARNLLGRRRRITRRQVLMEQDANVPSGGAVGGAGSAAFANA